MSIERAALQAGYPVGPLQISDELNMELMVKIRNATKAAIERDGGTYTPHPAEKVIDRMIEIGRPEQAQGRRLLRRTTRPASAVLSGRASPRSSRPPTSSPTSQDLKDRMLFIEAVETARCFDEGVIGSTAEANIGSIFGIGFPAN